MFHMKHSKNIISKVSRETMDLILCIDCVCCGRRIRLFLHHPQKQSCGQNIPDNHDNQRQHQPADVSAQRIDLLLRLYRFFTREFLLRGWGGTAGRQIHRCIGFDRACFHFRPAIGTKSRGILQLPTAFHTPQSRYPLFIHSNRLSHCTTKSTLRKEGKSDF